MTKVALNYSENLKKMVRNNELSIVEALDLWNEFSSKHRVSYHDYSWIENNIIYLGKNALRYPVEHLVKEFYNKMFVVICKLDGPVERKNVFMRIMSYLNNDCADHKINISQYDFLKKALESIIEN